MLVRVLGALGAAAMGAGAYGQFGPGLRATAGEPIKYAAWILAGGAVVLGGAIWLGTSGEASVRVGDPGVALDKGSLRRMPWYAIESVTFDGDAVKVTGTDELGSPMAIVCSVNSQPQAAAWIVREARARIPAVVEIDEEANVSEVDESAGERLTAEPAQLVGKHCAESGTIIAYEPDARMCRRCERVYHKSHVPAECACGASLESLQQKPKAAS